LLIVTLCALLNVKADQCFQFPASLASGSNCASGIPCKMGLYCDATATCSAQVAIGATCVSAIPNMCPMGSTCVGPIGSQTCIKNANPGQACQAPSPTPTANTAYCGTGLLCMSSLCIYGGYGDTCTAAANCQSNVCTSGMCATSAAVGQSCLGTSGSIPCNLGSYCNYAVTNPVCVAYPSSGACYQGMCAVGSQCILPSPGGNYTCTANASLATGSYCGGNDNVCSTGLCFENYCVAKLPTVCSSGFTEYGSDCGNTQVCTCNGLMIEFGVGACTNDPCYSLKSQLLQCVESSCYGVSITAGSLTQLNNALSYSGSCVNNNCATLATQYLTCSGAGMIYASFPLVLIFALIAAFFSKEF